MTTFKNFSYRNRPQVENVIQVTNISNRYIDKKIIGGAKVEACQMIGKTGNSGTRPSTLGTKKEAHLHWELILQRANEEI